jgi:hypothetical protein
MRTAAVLGRPSRLLPTGPIGSSANLTSISLILREEGRPALAKALPKVAILPFPKK